MVKVSRSEKKKHTFASLQKLFTIIDECSSFQIQIFSLESVETFERALLANSVTYTKTFSSSLRPSRKLQLVLLDSPIDTIDDSSKVILYSNKRDPRFVPYRFFLSSEEKANHITDKRLFEVFKNKSLSSYRMQDVDMYSYTASTLSTIQATVVFALTKSHTLSEICREVQSINAEFGSSFLVKCALNELLRLGMCKRVGNRYKLTLSDETVKEVCSGMI